MTDRLYTSANEIERARALWEKGVLLGERSNRFHKMVLYQLPDSSYLEVTWHIHFNVVLKATSFNDTDRLEPYLENISLKELLM